MLKIIAILSICQASFECLNVQESLINKIFMNYDSETAPKELIELSIDFNLRQIIGIDEKTQTIITDSFWLIEWYDNRLVWNETEFNNLDRIITQTIKFWKPCISVINSAEEDESLTIPDNNLVVIHSNGKISIVLNKMLKTTCLINLLKFPYDQHSCDIRITSFEIPSKTNNPKLSEEFLENPIWQLKNLFARNNTKNDFISNSGSFNEDLIFTLDVKRLSLHYMIDGIFPNILLNFLLLLVFFMAQKAQVATSKFFK